MAIKNGSKVRLNYTLKVEGKTVDSTEGKEPLDYVHGNGQIITGLEKKLEGLEKGDKKSITVSSEEAYGTHNPGLVQKVPRNTFKNPENLKKGDVVGGTVAGQRFQATIIEVNEKEVTLDLNHPLAGKSLDFDIEVLEIE